MKEQPNNILGEKKYVVQPHAISVFLGKLIMAGLLAVVITLLVRNPISEWALYLSIALFVFILATTLVEMMMARVIVDDRGITQLGFPGRYIHVEWHELKQIRLARGTVGHREMVVRADRKKIGLANDVFLLPSDGFWSAAKAVLNVADEMGIEVKASRFTDRDRWFYYDGEYLPGDSEDL